MKNKPILGLDIGSANLKYIAIDPDGKKVVNLGCIPLWSKKIDILKKTTGAVKYIAEKTKPDSINIVTSFEIVEKRPVQTLRRFYETLLNELEMPGYTLAGNCTVVNIETAKERASEFIGSAVQGAACVGTHIINDGILIAMNSASTIAVPIVEGRYRPISNHKFCSGEARWIGALYTPVEKVVHTGIINGHMTRLAPYGAHTVDIFNILNSPHLEQALNLYGVDRKLYPREDSFYKIYHSIVCINDEIDEISMIQARIFSLFVYYNLLDIVREMILQVFSALSMDPEKTPIVVCGIGKDMILRNALQDFNVHDVEKHIPFPLWSYIEAFGSALALLENMKDIRINITEVVTNERSKENQGLDIVQF